LFRQGDTYRFFLLLLFAVTGFALLAGEAQAQKRELMLTVGQSITMNLPRNAAAAGYQWYKNGQPIPGALAPTYVITEPGIYTVRAFNTESCPSPLSDEVEVKQANAQVDMAVTKQSETRQVRAGEQFEYLLRVVNKGPVAATDVVLKDALPEALEYVGVKSVTTGAADFDVKSQVLTWNIGSVNVSGYAELRLLVKAAKHGPVTNVAQVNSAEVDLNLANNRSADTKQIMGISIPNVFTPNGDGKNETFQIPGLETFTENEIVIMNRWGNSVYEKKNYRNDWTGDGLSEGTYFYILKTKDSQGVQEVYKGYVTLLRSR